jgi:2-C-methyl-D-erythritol 4-phosphate cytidylyltransferase
MRKDILAIVPSAGLGKRFGTAVKKPFVEIRGIPLFIHALKELHAIPFISEIVPVLMEEDRDSGRRLVDSYGLHKIKRIAPGGKERQDSVYNALTLISQHGGLILIHDGVRPLVSSELVNRLVHEMQDVDGVVPGLPVKETLKEVNKQGFVVNTVKRETVWSIQTPQVFAFDILKKAYKRAYKDGYSATDDAALVENIGGKVKIIPGSPYNIKVTTPEDLEMVQYLLSRGSA